MLKTNSQKKNHRNVVKSKNTIVYQIAFQLLHWQSKKKLHNRIFP